MPDAAPVTKAIFPLNTPIVDPSLLPENASARLVILMIFVPNSIVQMASSDHSPIDCSTITFHYSGSYGGCNPCLTLNALVVSFRDRSG